MTSFTGQSQFRRKEVGRHKNLNFEVGFTALLLRFDSNVMATVFDLELNEATEDISDDDCIECDENAEVKLNKKSQNRTSWNVSQDFVLF